jgi:hypothetical protein
MKTHPLLDEVMTMLEAENPAIIENPTSIHAKAWAFVALSSTAMIPEAAKFRDFAEAILKQHPQAFKFASRPAVTLSELGRRVALACKWMQTVENIQGAVIKVLGVIELVQMSPTPEGGCDCLACQLRRLMENPPGSSQRKDPDMPAWLPN